MTTEHRRLITADEVTGFQFECGQCRAKITIPASSLAPLVNHCPNCQDLWVADNQTASHAKFFDRVLALKTSINEINRISAEVGCKLSLELRPSEEKFGAAS